VGELREVEYHWWHCWNENPFSFQDFLGILSLHGTRRDSRSSESRASWGWRAPL
jgi:hypothetical protein